MPERCPGCGGPVDRYGEVEGRSKFTALPDTLEGIEAEASESKTEWREDAVRPMWDALRRLFNGCTVCGREALAYPNSELERVQDETAKAFLAAGKRQAFQQAADIAQERQCFNCHATGAFNSLADTLRQLAEGK